MPDDGMWAVLCCPDARLGYMILNGLTEHAARVLAGSMTQPERLDPDLANVLKKKRITTAKAINNFDIEAIYKVYPRKQGKITGLKSLAKQLKTVEQFNACMAATIAYRDFNYSNQTEPQYVMLFSTWANGRWLDWVQEGDTAKKAMRKEISENEMIQHIDGALFSP